MDEKDIQKKSKRLIFTLVCEHCNDMIETNHKICKPKCLNCNNIVNNDYINTPTKKKYIIIDDKGLFGIYTAPLGLARGERDAHTQAKGKVEVIILMISDTENSHIMKIKDKPITLKEYLLEILIEK